MGTGQLSAEICLEEQIADRFMGGKNRTHVLETVFPMGKSESGALTTLPEEK